MKTLLDKQCGWYRIPQFARDAAMAQTPEPQNSAGGRPVTQHAAVANAISPLASDVDQSRNLAARRDQALNSCNDQIKFFRRAARKAHWLHGLAQVMTIALSAVIPLILLADPTGLPSWLAADVSAKTLAAALAGLVAVVTGLTGTFRWHEAWIRFAFFREQLITERQQYELRVGDYGPLVSDEAALDTFGVRTQALRLAEAGQWRALEQAVAKVNGSAPHNRPPQHSDTL